MVTLKMVNRFRKINPTFSEELTNQEIQTYITNQRNLPKHSYSPTPTPIQPPQNSRDLKKLALFTNPLHYNLNTQNAEADQLAQDIWKANNPYYLDKIIKVPTSKWLTNHPSNQK